MQSSVVPAEIVTLVAAPPLAELLADRDPTVVAGSDAHIDVARTSRAGLLDRPLSDLLAGNPNQGGSSLHRTLAAGTADRIATAAGEIVNTAIASGNDPATWVLDARVRVESLGTTAKCLIWAETQEGGGTTFRFTLRAADETEVHDD